MAELEMAPGLESDMSGAPPFGIHGGRREQKVVLWPAQCTLACTWTPIGSYAGHLTTGQTDCLLLNQKESVWYPSMILVHQLMHSICLYLISAWTTQNFRNIHWKQYLFDLNNIADLGLGECTTIKWICLKKTKRKLYSIFFKDMFFWPEKFDVKYCVLLLMTHSKLFLDLGQRILKRKEKEPGIGGACL